MGDEYIQSLSEEEKIAFLKLFCLMIKADGKIDEDEIAFLKQTAKRYGIANSVIVDIIKNVGSVNYNIEAQKISDRVHALELLKELCFLANIDDNLHDKELDTLIGISRALNIEDDKLILINRFVFDTIILEKTGRVILEKNNG